MDLTPEGRKKLDEALEGPTTIEEQLQQWGTSPADQANMAAFLASEPKD